MVSTLNINKLSFPCHLDLGVSGAEAVVDPGEHVVSREVLRAGGRGVYVDSHCGVLVI